MHILSKSTYIKGEQCTKALYLFKKHPYLRDKLSIEQRAKFKRGTDVGILARSCFPGGINMTPSSPSQFEKMFKKTMDNLNNPNINVMYEAVFIYNDTLIMLDIIVRDGDKWRAIEVKSSLALNETYYKDAALQYYVLKGCKVPLSDFQLMYMNANYVKNGDIDLSKLFVFQSAKDYAEQEINNIDKNIKRFKEVLNQLHAPNTEIGIHCNKPYPCEFQGVCWKKVPKDSFLYTTAYDEELLFQEYNNGIYDNLHFKRHIDPFSLEMNQVDALEQSTYYIDYKLFYELIGKKDDAIAFLNLLFYKPPVPILDNCKPYQEFLLAFSILSNSDKSVFNWNCLNDYSLWEKGIEILIEKLKKFEKVVCFSPQNINFLSHRYNIFKTKDTNYKIVNLKEILQQSNFFHQKIKHDFSLKNIYESIFTEETLFEHSRILLNATSSNKLEHALVNDDMEKENKCLQKIYNHLVN